MFHACWIVVQFVHVYESVRLKCLLLGKPLILGKPLLIFHLYAILYMVKLYVYTLLLAAATLTCHLWEL